MKILRISKSWFYSAGTKYGWVKDGFDVRGVGIAKQLLMDMTPRAMLGIVLDGKKYTLNCAQARDFVVKFKSVEKRGQAKLCIVSKSILTPLEPEKTKSVSVSEIVNNNHNLSAKAYIKEPDNMKLF